MVVKIMIIFSFYVHFWLFFKYIEVLHAQTTHVNNNKRS